MGCSLNTYWRVGKTNGNSKAAQRNCRKEPHPRAAGTEGRWLGIRTPKLRRALGIELQISEKGTLPTDASVSEGVYSGWPRSAEPQTTQLRQQPTSAAGVKAITRRLLRETAKKEKEQVPLPTPRPAFHIGRVLELTLAEPDRKPLSVTGSPWETEKCECGAPAPASQGRPWMGAFGAETRDPVEVQGN